MRIGVDTRLLYYQPAGIGLYAARLLRALAALDPENQYTVLQSRKDRCTLAQAPNFVRRDLLTPPHHRLEQATLPLELAPLRLDLLHSPDFIPPLRWRGLSVITIHDLAFLRLPHLLTEESRRYYGQTSAAVKRADAILATSESTRRDLADLIGVNPARVTVTYQAANERFYPLADPDRLAALRASLGLTDEVVLFVGTIEPRKDLPTLLRAFAAMRQSRPQTSLVIAGRPGWLCQQVFDLADELRLGNSLRFLTNVPSGDLPALYSAARLFVLPSLYEGFGMPVLEAMACGTPVICTNVASLPEVAGDAAVLVPVGDPDALAQAMLSCLSNPARLADMSRRGLAQAARFSWAETARLTLNVYRQLGAE